MAQKDVISNNDMMVIKEEYGVFTATLGNIRNCINPGNEKTIQQVLLRDIRNESGSIHVEKQWFDNRGMIKLARKNMDKKLTFNGHCKVIVYKENGNLYEAFLFTKLNDTSLTF